MIDFLVAVRGRPAANLRTPSSTQFLRNFRPLWPVTCVALSCAPLGDHIIGLAVTVPENSPDETLQAVMAWARMNKNTLQSGGSQELGQWEGTAQGESVLLVRQMYLNRILLGRKFDLRAIMTAWRDAGVIVAENKRFTVYARVADKQLQGARFVAFRWSRLEEASLSKK